MSMTTETNEDLYDESLGDETLLEIENIELMPDANFTTKIHGVHVFWRLNNLFVNHNWFTCWPSCCSV